MFVTASSLTNLQTIPSVGGMGDLIVNGLRYSAGTDVDDVKAGRATPESATATQDGRHMADGWHEGEAAESDWIYFERFGLAGRESHGWIHAESRRLLQVG